jgi:hypothetical protein
MKDSSRVEEVAWTTARSIQLNSPNANTLNTLLYNCLHNNFKLQPPSLLTDYDLSGCAIEAGDKERTPPHKFAPVDIEIYFMH